MYQAIDRPRPKIPETSILTVTVQEAELDTAAALSLMARVQWAFTMPPALVVIDMSRVRFMDSLAVSCLVRLVRSAPPSTRVALAAMSKYPATVARVTHLAEVLEIFETVSSAIASVRING